MSDLSEMQKTVLNKLASYNRTEGAAARVADIVYGTLRNVHTSKISAAMRSLERKGLVERVVNEKTMVTWRVV